MSAIRLAIRGAQTLGLLAGHEVTVKGWAYATAFQTLGFRLAECRLLTSNRLVAHAPGFAALLRSILLDHSAIDLVIDALATAGGGPMSIGELAIEAHRADEGMARALFGSPPISDEAWEIRPWVRFNLKAALYDVGLLDSPLAPGASGTQRPGGYDPRADLWCLGVACGPRWSQQSAVSSPATVDKTSSRT